MADTKPKYDTDRALEVLAAHGERTEPHYSSSAREEAAEHLLDALAAFDKKAFIAATRRGDTTLLEVTRGRTVTISYNDNKFFVALREFPIPPTTVDVIFNRATGSFESTAEETDLVPVPGLPVKRRRDALVAVSQAIVAVLRGK
jgi:hypothetical protein